MSAKKYFVAYSHKEGFGNGFVILGNTVMVKDDLEYIEELIMHETRFENIVVINYFEVSPEI